VSFGHIWTLQALSHRVETIKERIMRRAFLICLFVLLTQTLAAAQSVIRIARIADIPDQFVGGEILRVVYQRLNIAIELIDLPSKRALALSSSGAVDGEVHRIANVANEYPTLIRVTPPINYIEPAVFVTSLQFEVRGWDSIKDYSVGIVRGVGSSEAGTKGMARVTAATGLDNLIHMLDAGRFDLMVSDLFSGRVAIKKLKLDARIHPLAPVIERINIYHYLHERHRALALKVAAVIQEMQDSGELARLRAQLIQQVLDATERGDE
jgi:polar amino acid transport system substrate-binding protein